MQPLVRVTADAFTVEIALAYAGPDNFTGRPVYTPGAGCFLHADAAAALRRAATLADAMGLHLKLLDAFRPAEAQWALWAHTPDPEFLADPRRGSDHSRGIAVDLTLTRDGRDLDMGTAFDAFTPLSHHGVTGIGAEALRNRSVLLGLMAAAGWRHNPHEWWHYQLPKEHKRYALLSDSILGGYAMMPGLATKGVA